MPSQRLAIALLISALYAQTQPPEPAPPRFATASVKPEASRAYIRKDVDPVMLRWHSTPLRVIADDAWHLRGYQVIGWPMDMASRFDIDARTDGPTTTEQKYEMLRTLIVERFGLKFHREMRDLPGYALVIAKNGPKLHDVKEGESSSGEPGIDEEYGVKIGHRVRMADWVGFISSELGAPFEDDTGLMGLYDFKLEWSPDGTPRGGNEPRDPDAGVSLFVALQQQLGLKLEQKKIPVEMFIVDHVNKVPTEN
jgi:uncharacterized protein (TIGR03435 family)